MEKAFPLRRAPLQHPFLIGAGHSGTSLDIEKPQPPVWKAVSQSWVSLHLLSLFFSSSSSLFSADTLQAMIKIAPSFSKVFGPQLSRSQRRRKPPAPSQSLHVKPQALLGPTWVMCPFLSNPPWPEDWSTARSQVWSLMHRFGRLVAGQLCLHHLEWIFTGRKFSLAEEGEKRTGKQKQHSWVHYVQVKHGVNIVVSQGCWCLRKSLPCGRAIRVTKLC